MSTPAFLQGLLHHERGLFAKVLAAVPDTGLDYQVDPKSRTARDIVEHLIGHNLDLLELLEDGAIHHRNQVPIENMEDAAAQFDRSLGQVIDKLGTLSNEDWNAVGQFFAGDHLVMEAPRQQLAWIFFLDAIHHRGQLSTYLRPMGSSVPAIYGPSADDDGGDH